MTAARAVAIWWEAITAPNSCSGPFCHFGGLISDPFIRVKSFSSYSSAPSHNLNDWIMRGKRSLGEKWLISSRRQSEYKWLEAIWPHQPDYSPALGLRCRTTFWHKSIGRLAVDTQRKSRKSSPSPNHNFHHYFCTNSHAKNHAKARNNIVKYFCKRTSHLNTTTSSAAVKQIMWLGDLSKSDRIPRHRVQLLSCLFWRVALSLYVPLGAA